MRSRLDERIDPTGPTDLVSVALLPAQFIELRHRRSNWTPELRLMVAVLDDAIRTYRQCASSPIPGTRRLFCDTVEWFASPDARAPFAFENICDALGLDPESIRERLRACRIETPPVVLCDAGVLSRHSPLARTHDLMARPGLVTEGQLPPDRRPVYPL